ncbi:hypothetical protein [Neisseria mucosa]|uniref:hypothetical protein n=1 Tax=Neisseria mucosa TaxID=488 RepID=UPI0018788295|nr:hypothetical protein [Neisseria mucosa]
MIKGVRCNRRILPCIIVDDDFDGFHTFRNLIIDLGDGRSDIYYGVVDSDMDSFDHVIYQAKKKALNLNCFAYHIDVNGDMKCIFSPKA